MSRTLVKIYVWESSSDGQQVPSEEDLANAEVHTSVPEELDNAEESTATWRTKVRAVFSDDQVMDCWWGDSPHGDDSLRWMCFTDWTCLSDMLDEDNERLDDL